MLDANENLSKNDKSLEDWVNNSTKDTDRRHFLEISNCLKSKVLGF